VYGLHRFHEEDAEIQNDMAKPSCAFRIRGVGSPRLGQVHTWGSFTLALSSIELIT